MASEHRSPPAPRAQRRGPELVAPTNRINVALPFSKIQTQEPTEELRELAALVTDLAHVVARLDPSEATRQLHERAVRLISQLR